MGLFYTIYTLYWRTCYSLFFWVVGSPIMQSLHPPPPLHHKIAVTATIKECNPFCTLWQNFLNSRGPCKFLYSGTQVMYLLAKGATSTFSFSTIVQDGFLLYKMKVSRDFLTLHFEIQLIYRRPLETCRISSWHCPFILNLYFKTLWNYNSTALTI